jgi:hypothetical protein
MAMLEGVDDLTLTRLNEATQAWAEQEYNRKRHSEIDDTPLARFLGGPAVTRPCPDAATLRLAFTRTERRTLRKSDGTAVIEGRWFEVPNRYRHLTALEVRFAAWDLNRSTWSIHTPAWCSAGCSRRTRPPTPPAGAAACSRSPPNPSRHSLRRRAASDRSWRE